MLTALIFVATVFLAYANGANDNFKGVATLFGSGTANYRRAILWATLTTFAGCLCAPFLAQELFKNFSGKGLVPESLVSDPTFALSVAAGAALTVMVATLTGFPISTTHGLTGALLGTGLAAVGREVNFSKLGTSFALPLIVSPVLGVIIGSAFYSVLHFIRIRARVQSDSCVCVGETSTVAAQINGSAAVTGTAMEARAGTQSQCAAHYSGSFLGVQLQSAVDFAHYFSAGAMSFARGLNDTPKIVGLLLIASALNINYGALAIALGMAVGGLLNAKRVAETMSKKITGMNHGQGCTANFTTSLLVIGASVLGQPVSTTHVSVGAISGIGLITGQASRKVILQIFLAWVGTLPFAALFGACCYWICSAVLH